MGSEWILGSWLGGRGLDSTGSGQGPVAGCECGDEPSGSCATELVSYSIVFLCYTYQKTLNIKYNFIDDHNIYPFEATKAPVGFALSVYPSDRMLHL
jgi:hypothetical protein